MAAERNTPESGYDFGVSIFAGRSRTPLSGCTRATTL